MKINRLFTIAAAALMMVACSSEETALNNNPAAGSQMQFTATIAAPNSGATTRTEYTEVTTGEAAGTINVAWKVGDEIALIHNGVKDVATVKAVNADGSATIIGNVTGATNEADVRLVYPAARVGEVTGGLDGTEYSSDSDIEGKLLTQDGTLKYIQNNLDFRSDMNQLSVEGDKATLAYPAEDMDAELAIWKLTLQDDAETPAALSATQVKIKGGESVLASTTTLTAGTSVVTLAIPTDVAIDGALTIEATVGSDTYAYTKAEGATFNPGTYYQSTVTMTKAGDVDLSMLTADYEAQDGDVLTGTLAGNYKISIADGATVTLDGVTINGYNSSDYKWAGITCEGDATIILKDETTNTVKGFYSGYPGIQAGPTGTMLVIKGGSVGTGSLTASANGWAAGIGGGYQMTCGNIEIQGGVITATGGTSTAGIGGGGNDGSVSGGNCGDITISGGTVNATGGFKAAGIGGGVNATCSNITISGGSITVKGGVGGAAIGSGCAQDIAASCGDITISGGTIEATAGDASAGIGSGFSQTGVATCGNITITSGVTSVTAKKSVSDLGPNSIGAGRYGTCGTVTIGDTKYWENNAYVNDGNIYLTTSPIIYPAS